MKILAVDTALAACSAAIFDSRKNQILASRFEPMSTGQAERLAPMVQEVIASSGLGFSALDRIAATVGPGTFTGLRIGLSFARGLGLALARPVVGISTLYALAASVADNPFSLPIAAAIDARRGNVYFQLFSASLNPLNPPQMCSLAEAARALPQEGCLAVGSAASGLSAEAGCSLPLGAHSTAGPTDAAIVAHLASLEVNLLPPHPLYLRSHDARPHAPFLQQVDP